MTDSQISRAAMLLLADGRFPAGGHTHSGGMEVVVADGTVHDGASLASFLAGRLRTQGLVQAALAAAACSTDAAGHDELDAHASARHPAAVQRRVSRAQGRALLRAGRACWPSPVLDALALTPGGPHQAIAFGAIAAAAGLRPADAALVSTLGAVQGPATAAVRLLGLDPYAVHLVLADLAGACEAVADAAAVAATGSFWDLPADTGPRLDIDAVRHEQWEVRLFAS
jgi:urease accessory protein